MLVGTCYNVNHSKTISLTDLDILFVVVLGQHKAACPLSQEEDAANVISFKEHIILFFEDHWLQQWADPGYEGVRFLVKEEDFLV